MAIDPADAKFREAAFKYLNALLAGRATLSRNEIETPFYVEDQRLTLVDPQRGIHKPHAMRHLLSITTVVPAKGRKVWYVDQTKAHREIYAGETGIRYSFMGSNPDAAQNQSLQDAADNQIPVIYFLGIKPKLYQPIFPVFLTGWDRHSLSVGIVFAPTIERDHSSVFPQNDDERRYGLRLAKYRLHQVQFREAVIDAYQGRCVISGLPEPRLLDAAHIASDVDEEFGQPVIVNGLPLSKLHHAAFDANLIGIDPDGLVHVSERLLSIHDGPLLEEGLKGVAGRRIRAPMRDEDRPDRDRLALRFEIFKKAA